MDRLLLLVRDGDLEAAEQLWITARRAADHAAAQEAALALGEPARLAELGAEVWATGALAELTALLGELGLVFEVSDAARLDRLLEAAHGQRRVRLLSRADVLRVLLEARHGDVGWAMADAGRNASGSTTLALAVRRTDGAGDVTVGIAETESVDLTPALEWPELAPWQDDPRDNLERLQAWAAWPRGERVCAIGARPGRRAVRAPGLLEHVRDEIERVLAERPSERHFERLTALGSAALEHDAERGAALLERVAQALERWPDTLRSFAVEDLERALAAPVWSLFRYAFLALETPQQLAAVVRHPVLAHVRRLAAGLMPHVPGARRVAEAVLEILNAHPIEHLEVMLGLPLEVLLRAPRPQALRVLDLRARTEALPRIAKAPLLDGLRELMLADPVASSRHGLYALAGEDELTAMLDAPGRDSLEALTLGGQRQVGPGQLRAVVQAAPRLGGLRRLSLTSCGLRDADVALLAGAPLRLTALDLRDNLLGPDAARALVESESAPGLRSLRWSRHVLGDAGCEVLSDARLAALEHLELDWHPPGTRRGTKKAPGRIGSMGAQALARAPWLDQLRWLDLSRNRIEDAGLTALCKDDRLTSLEHLVLSDNAVGPDGAAALAATPSLERLRVLILDDNPIGATGLAALAGSPHLRSLEALSLARCDLDEVAALATSDHLPALRWLILRENPIGNAGASALAESGRLGRLEYIHLYRTRIGKPGLQALEGSRHLAGRLDGLPGLAAHCPPLLPESLPCATPSD